MTNGKIAIKPHTQESSAVAAIPKSNPPINNPMKGMIGILQNIAGRLIPL